MPRAKVPGNVGPHAIPADAVPAVEAWLTQRLEQLERGKAQAKTALKIANVDYIRGQLQYFDHAAGAVRWLLWALRPTTRKAKPDGTAQDRRRTGP